MKFTMAEFIARHGLGVNVKDAGATKLIAQKLKASGFIQKKMWYKGKVSRVWTNEHKERRDLKSKLAFIKL